MAYSTNLTLSLSSPLGHQKYLEQVCDSFLLTLPVHDAGEGLRHQLRD